MIREPRWTGRTIGALCSASLHLAIVWLAVIAAPYIGNHASVTAIADGVASGPASASGHAPGTGAERAGDLSPFVRANEAGMDAGRAISLPPGFAGLFAAIPSEAARLRVYLSVTKVIDHLWQSTIFAIAIGLLTLAVRRNRARIRYGLWLAASLKFLVPLPLLVWIAQRLLPVTAIRDLAPHSLVSFVSDIQQPLIMPIATAIWPAASSLPQTTAMSHWRGMLLLAIWACGMLAVAAMRYLQWRRLERIVATGTPLELPTLALREPIEIRSVTGLIEPGVVGWQEAVLLMPAGIEQHLAAPELEAIVLHELCHIRRRDNLTAGLHMLVEAIFWFHPLVWWIGARLVDERERACDEHVLRTVARPGDYARGILTVCKQYVASPLACVSGVSSANVRKRIDAILANRIGEAIGPWKTAMLGVFIALLVIVPVGAAVRTPWLSSTVSPSALLSSLSGASVARPLTGIRLRPTRTSTGAQESDSTRKTPRARYALVMDEGTFGPSFRPSSRTDCWPPRLGNDRCTGRLGPGVLTADSITPAHLAALLAYALDARVEDHTGLNGRFTLHLTWTAGRDDGALLDAVRDQLGLRLVPIGNGASQ